MNELLDVIVLGRGCLGLALTDHLSQGNLSVLNLDAGHSHSPSRMSGGIIRALHQNPKLTEMALASLPEYQKLAIQHPELFSETGHVSFIPRSQISKFQASFQLLRDQNYALKELPGHSFEDLQWGPEDQAFFEPRALKGQVPQILELTQERLKLRPNLLMKQDQVQSYRCHGSEIEINSEYQTYRAKTLVVALGPWSLKFLAQAGVHLDLELKHIRSQEVAGNFKSPGFFHYGKKIYFSPGKDQPFAGGAATFGSTKIQDPKSFREHLPDFTFTQNSREALDAYVQESSGVLGFLCGHPRVFVATGFGGTGFKIAPEIGRLGAQIIQEEKGQHFKSSGRDHVII